MPDDFSPNSADSIIRLPALNAPTALPRRGHD
jgi:hypothetical protein